MLSANTYTPQEAINKLLKHKFIEGFELNAVHDYYNATGEVEFRRVRLKKPNSREKCIMPLSVNADGLYVLKEPTYTRGKKPIYNMLDILTYTDETIFVVEGEACADKLKSIGIIATTSGSSNSALNADWSSLLGKTIIVWPDADEQGEKYATDVAEILLQHNCKVFKIDVKKLNLLPKEDCVDWVKNNPDASKDDILKLPMIECQPEECNSYGEDKSTMLLELMYANDAEFFHDDEQTPYVTIDVNGRRETHRINADGFHNLLSQMYWKVYRESVSNHAKLSAISAMEAMACNDGKCYKVFNRVGLLDNNIYIFTANKELQVIRVSSEGWEVITNNSPVKFAKCKNMSGLPIPIRGGSIDLLWKYINISEEDKILILTWLLECLRINTDYAILMLRGCPGSAKSTTQDFLRRLIDPNRVNLRGAPKNQDDITISAINNYLLSYNNLSYLSPITQDELCQVSTGGGVGKRKHYSDHDEVLCDVKRPLIMNGINNPITALDLLSRSVVVELPEINSESRKVGSELNEEFLKEQPYILGALYDLLVSCLKILPTVKLSQTPRLADFALLGTAVEKVLKLDEGVFLKAFNSNIEGNMIDSLDEQPVISALCKYIDVNGSYNGTVGKLLEMLNVAYKAKFTHLWPSSARAFGCVLRSATSVLQKIGIEVKILPRNNRGIQVAISKI